MKPVGVIILNWNGAELMRRFLPSVIENTNAEIADVIVVDNGSTDNSREVLAKEFPEVKTLFFSKNYGYAEGYNRSIKELGYEYSVLLNSDVETPENWLTPMYEYVCQNKNVVACQPKILSVNHRESFEYAGASGGFIDKHGYPYCRGRLFDTVEEDHGQYDSVEEIFWATGACLFVRTDVYLAVGGLDKDFFAHMEEIDLCWRIRTAGYSIVVVPESRIFHLGGGSLPASNPRKTYLNFRNNLFLLYKNMPDKEGARLLFIRRLYDTLAFFMFVAKFDFKNAKAVLKAHNDYRKQHKRYASVRPDKSIMGDYPCFKENIILSYYLKGKKHYRDL